MLYLIALALIITLAIYLCARLFPRIDTTPHRALGTSDQQHGNADKTTAKDQRAAEGEPS